MDSRVTTQYVLRLASLRLASLRLAGLRLALVFDCTHKALGTVSTLARLFDEANDLRFAAVGAVEARRPDLHGAAVLIRVISGHMDGLSCS